jgi:hypothetical protein
MAEVVRISDFDTPENSVLLTYHAEGGDNFGIPSPTRAALIIEWITEASTNCEPLEADAGVGPIAESPCSAPVDLERYGTEASREAWRAPDGINTLLVGDAPSNPGACGDAVCHGSPNTGGSLWLAQNDQPGAAECNLSIVEAYILRGDIDNSDLLTKPLGEISVTPNERTHGGAVVFRGRDDPDYILLRNWIISGGVL